MCLNSKHCFYSVDGAAGVLWLPASITVSDTNIVCSSIFVVFNPDTPILNPTTK